MQSLNSPRKPRHNVLWPSFVGALGSASILSQACSDPFESCETRRTFPAGGAAGSSAGSHSDEAGGLGGVAGAESGPGGLPGKAPGDGGANSEVGAGGAPAGGSGVDNATTGGRAFASGGAGGTLTNGGSGGNAVDAGGGVGGPDGNAAAGASTGGATNAGGSFGGALGTGGSTPGPTCGNGVRENLEACDDNNSTSGDGCSATCALEVGWVCGSTSPTVCRRPSCAALQGNECQGADCCASLTVPGGTFQQGSGTDTYQSTVSSFRLDEYEVTVARFRAFVQAYDQWHVAEGNPKSGSGAHPRVIRSGWNMDWPLAANPNELIVNLQLPNGTWALSGNDNLPINNVDWYTAFAFCYWDGGRLPTEAEWEFAAAGGSASSIYPWGDSPVLTNQQDSTSPYAVYACLGDGSTSSLCTASDILRVGSKPAGRGMWGHLDLAGSMQEWVLDAQAPYPASPATNYASVDGDVRTFRGGSWKTDSDYVVAAYRAAWFADLHDEAVGIRCARNP